MMEEFARLGFLLDEEQTEKVLEISDYLGIRPDKFIEHCIDVLWERLNDEE